MCGIVGFISLEKKTFEFNHHLIKKMLDVTSHRGPDEVKKIIGEQYAFGTNRLSIQSLKEGQQPIEDESYIAGFNGEIFNYLELKKKYFNESNLKSEIALILALYKKLDANFIKTLKGQFAIYIYDKKNKKLLLFRDRMGIRPIYYSFDKKNKSFIFASEIKAILKISKNNHKLSKKAFAQTAMFWTTIGSQTAFEEISLLPFSHYIEINHNLKISTHRYENIFSKNKLDYKENLYELLENSVNSQIFGEVGFCSYLSGGIDSTVIAYLLKKISKKKIDTFSISFQNPEYDESKAQKEISNFLGSNHHQLDIKNSDISKNFYETMKATETFLFRTAPGPMFLLSKFVREKGHKVFFSGEGADEIFFGYDIFFETKIRKFWSKDINSKNRFLLLKKLYNYLPQFTNSRYFSMIKDFYKSSLTLEDDIFYSHFIRWSNYEYMKKFFNLSDDKVLNQNILLEDFLSTLPKDFVNMSLLRRAQYIECSTLLSNYLLSSQGDRVSLANSVEGRYPYLDEDLICALINISDKSLAPGINHKKKFRETFKNLIPEKILNRPKFAYQAPEARSFFDNKNNPSQLAQEYLDNANNLDFQNYENLKSLYKKIKDPLSSNRLGFRDNMAFIIGMSDFCLQKIRKNYKN